MKKDKKNMNSNKTQHSRHSTDLTDAHLDGITADK